MKMKRMFAAFTGALIAASQYIASAQTPPTADLSLWLRADAGVVLSGAKVVEWDDQSGLDHHAYQDTAASQPTLLTSGTGKLGLRFDGLNDFLRFTNDVNVLAGVTIFLVTANNSAAQNGGTSFSDSPAIFWNETSSWGWLFLSPFQTNVNWRVGSTLPNNNERYARPASIGAGYSLTALVKNSDVETLYVNKALARTATDKAFSTFGVRADGYIGGGQSTYFAGDILEVLVYNAALSDTDRQSVENYLSDKYLTNQIPTVAISSPANFASFSAPANITITADAIDDVSVTNVEFFVNGISVGNDATAPYSFAWNGVAGGAYTLTAKATDDQGAWAFSSPVIVRVNYATPQEGPLLSGLGLWYKADAGVSVTGGKVTGWADQSGYNRNAVQPLSNLQPTYATAGNGMPAVSFNGISNSMTFSMPMNGLSGLTIAIVANNKMPQNTGSGGQGAAILQWGETGSWGGLNVGVFQNSVTWRIGTGQAQSSSPNFPGPAHTRPASALRNYTRTVVVKNGTSEMLYTNGVLATTVTGKLATTSAIDGNGGNISFGLLGNVTNYFCGEVQEILVYTNTLSAQALADLDTYLTTKYHTAGQPTVTITSPADKTVVTVPANLTITTAPADPDGTITNVQFFDSGVLMGIVSNAPWQFTITNATQGSHVFTARAMDNDGFFNYSAPVFVFAKAASGFTLIDNFENRALAPLLFQGNWLGDGSWDYVRTDTVPGGNTNNKALIQVKNNSTMAYPVLLSQGATGTLFFRAASTTWSQEQLYVGLGAGAGFGFMPTSDFEVAMTRFTGANLANKMVGVRYGATRNDSLANFASDTWYKIWMVVNNSADTWNLYIQGGGYATPTQIANGATSDLPFWNGTTSRDLSRFMYQTAATTVSTGGFWLDDIYLAEGANLSDPTIPPPPSLSIVRSGENIIVSWPSSASNVFLQSSPALAPASWTDVNVTPVIVGDQATVTLPLGENPVFYSLRH